MILLNQFFFQSEMIAQHASLITVLKKMYAHDKYT